MRFIKLILAVVILTITSPAWANHVLGGNITYECLGANEYEITLSIYQDCFSASDPAPVDETILFYPSGCGLFPFSDAATYAGLTEISDLCPSEINNSSCNGGFAPGTSMIQYTITVTLDPTCEWTVAWNSGNWNYFNNMDNTLLPSPQFEAQIIPAEGCNDSVVITSDPDEPAIPFVCSGDTISHSLFVDNPNGYELEFSFAPVLTLGGVPAPLTSPFDEAIPGIEIDSSTGQLDFVAPTNIGDYVIGIQIDMYDANGDLVGSVLESMAVVVRICDLSPTYFISPPIQNTNADAMLNADSSMVTVCAGDSLCFSVAAENANIFRSVSMTTDFDLLFPGQTAVISGTNPVVANICMITDDSMVGATVVTFDAIDDDCEAPSSDQQQITIEVLSDVNINLSDSIICKGDTVILDVFGASNLTWEVLSGDMDPSFGCASCPNQTAIPDFDTQFMASIAGVGGMCSAADTVFVQVSLSNLDAQITDETCLGNDGAVDLSISGGTGSYDVLWDLPFAGEDLVDVPGGTYTATITDLGFSSCIRDTSVTVGTVTPTSGFIFGDSTICDGEDAYIHLSLLGTGPFTINLYDQNAGVYLAAGLVSDGDSILVNPTVTNTYTLELITDSNVPSCQYAITSDVAINVRPIANASFLDPGIICEGDNVDVEISIDQAGTFNLQYSLGGLDQGIISAQDGDVINVSTADGSLLEVVSLGYPNTPTCTNVNLVPLNIGLTDSIFSSLTDTLCQLDGTAYQINANIVGGDAGSYLITPSTVGAGTLVIGNPSVYTSDWIPSGSGQSFTITDQYNCNTSTVDIAPYACPIITYSGTIDTSGLAANGGFLSPCEDGMLTLTPDGNEVLDPNDVLSFILHDSPDNTIGVVYAISNAPSWDISANLSFPPLVYGDTYYVSAVAGDDAGGGFVDLGASFVSVSTGVPVIFFENPTATLGVGGAICNGDTLPLDVVLTGQGDWTISYEIDNVLQADISGSTSPLVIPATQNGTYEVVNVSNNYCAGTVLGGTSAVTVNPLPTATLDADAQICYGLSHDFVIDFTGTPDWNLTVVHEDSLGIQTTDNIGPFAVNNVNYAANSNGTYWVSSITDGNGCINDQSSASVDLSVLPLPTFTFVTPDTMFCAGDCVNLQMQVSGTNDWSITFSQDGGAFQAWNATSTNHTEVICTPGTFEVSEITDGNGCVGVVNDDVVLTEIALPVIDAGGDQSLCAEDELMIGSADPGNSYDYLWTGDIEILDSDTIAQPTISTDVASSYNLSLEVSDGFCVNSEDIIIEVNALPLVDAGNDTYICFGDQIQLNGVGDLNCTWEDNGWFTAPGELVVCSPMVEPAMTATFVLSTSNAFGCSALDSVVVYVGEELTVDADYSGAVCFGECSGYITIDPQGGFPEYTIDWGMGPSSIFDTTDLCAGDYPFTVSDSIGCEVSGSITMLEQGQYFIEDVLLTDPVCTGDSTGVIEVISPTASWYHLVENADTNSTGLFTGLMDGAFTIEATDINGCLADTIVDLVYLSAPITLSTNVDSSVICVNQPVQLSCEAAGGFAPLICAWYDCASADPGCEVGSGEFFNPYPTEETLYFVLAVDGNGCSSDTLSVQTYYNDPLEVLVSDDDEIEICQEDCETLQATVIGGTGTYDFLWTAYDMNGSGPFSTDSEVEVCPELSTIYVATIDDGCTLVVADTLSIVVNPIPDVQFELSEYVACEGSIITFSNLTDSSFFGLCEWDLGDGSVLPVCGDLDYQFNTSGYYYPSLTIVSEDGCIGADSLESPLFISGFPTADFSWTPESVNVIDNEVLFLNNSSGGAGFQWSINGQDFSTLISPSLVLPPEDLAFHLVCLETVNEYGCVDTLCQDLIIDSEQLIYVPNAFTPDNDGRNDVFLPYVSGFDPNEYEFLVLDRWGNVMFRSNNIGEAWLGDHSGGTHFAQNDVYVWTVTVKDLVTEEYKVFKGHVTLFR